MHKSIRKKNTKTLREEWVMVRKSWVTWDKNMYECHDESDLCSTENGKLCSVNDSRANIVGKILN